MKSIMIIGAGKAQVPLIDAARREGYYTVVCDIDKNAPGVALADDFLPVSTKDRFGLLEAAKNRHIDGIAANSEYAMCDAAYIANRLNLVGNPEAAITVLSSKSKFRLLQKKNGLFSPSFLSGNSINLLPEKEAQLTFPIIIKPDENSGTRGATIVSNPKELDRIRESTLACSRISRNGKAIAEEFVPMPTRDVIEGELFVHCGEILWDGFFSTIRSENAILIPMTYSFPLYEKTERIEAAKKALETVIRAADVVHGEYNVEMYFTEWDEPFIIEINPRQGGNDLPRYVREHCGIDYDKLLVTTAMGDDCYWNSVKNKKRENRRIIHHVLYPLKNGRLKGIEIADLLMNYVSSVHLDVAPGDEIKAAYDGMGSIGFVDLEFTDAQEQRKISFELENLIKLKYDLL